MRLLVTNDDGIASEGIWVLARHLRAAGHDLVVVAPDHNASGTGAALGDLRPDVALEVQRVERDGADAGIEAWALAGTPALTVVAARLGAFGDPPDVVVSGINAGLNTGRSVLHSGTVGAALTAQNFGISGLAVSIERSEPWHWDTAAALAVQALGLVVEAPPRSVLNLNVPAVPADEVRGLRWTSLAPFGAVRAAVAARSDVELVFELEPTGYEPPPDTDQGAVEAGWASLTTLVGIAEAWPAAQPDGDVEVHLTPGAPLHALHVVPDASAAAALRRPLGPTS